MRTINFEEYQKELIGYFKKINILFLENNIKWFAYAGTLLGSVRNQKIIPWDDDIDMAMKSNDFYSNKNSIIELIGELNFSLRSRDEHIGLVCNKIISDEYVIVDVNGEKFITNFCIDIFVFVPIKKKSSIRNAYFSIYNKVIFIFSRFWKPLPDYKMKNGKAVKINFLTHLMVWIGRLFVLWFLPIHLFEKKRLKSIKEGNLYSLHCKESYLNDYFSDDLIEWEFEGEKIFIQENYEKILRKKFGDKYLELPEEKFRNPSHIYNGEYKN